MYVFMHIIKAKDKIILGRINPNPTSILLWKGAREFFMMEK